MIFHCQDVQTCLSPVRDGAPYCEKDYQIHFGVQCEACHQFITGKVLEVRHRRTHIAFFNSSQLSDREVIVCVLKQTINIAPGFHMNPA